MLTPKPLLQPSRSRQPFVLGFAQLTVHSINDQQKANRMPTDAKNPSQQIDHWFKHPDVIHDQKVGIEAIRNKGAELACVISNLCPPCPDRSVAIRKVREAVTDAIGSIVLGGE